MLLSPAVVGDAWWELGPGDAETVHAPPRAHPAPRFAEEEKPKPSGTAWQAVYASWYGPGFYGNRTACGQIFSPDHWGVAHPTLPCGTLVAVSFNGRVITAPVTDRGPFIDGRELDLSSAVAEALGVVGVREVELGIPASER